VCQDLLFVLAGKRMGDVCEALKLGVNLLSLTHEELVFKLRCAERGAGVGPREGPGNGK
jgi:hypothetical protein